MAETDISHCGQTKPKPQNSKGNICIYFPLYIFCTLGDLIFISHPSSFLVSFLSFFALQGFSWHTYCQCLKHVAQLTVGQKPRWKSLALCNGCQNPSLTVWRWIWLCSSSWAHECESLGMCVFRKGWGLALYEISLRLTKFLLILPCHFF